jgi:hypothetical protein
MTSRYRPLLALTAVGLALGALAAGWLASTTGPAQAESNTVWAEPASATVDAGGSATVNVIAEGPPLGPVPPPGTPRAGGIGSWDVTVIYDETVVNATACARNPAGGGDCGFSAPGRVDVLGFVGMALEGQQILATITFDAVGAVGESTPIAITVNYFFDGNGDPTNPTATDGMITVQESSSAPTPVETGSDTIGPGGGTVNTGSGDPVEASVSFPPEALAADQEITIDAYESATLADPPPGRDLLSRAFTFGPEGLTLSRPMTIVLTYTDDEVAGLDETSLTVELLIGNTWQTVPDCVDPSVPSPDPCVVGVVTSANTIVVTSSHTYDLETFRISGTATAPTDVAETGSAPGNGWSVSLYVWLPVAVGALILAASGLTALRLRRRSR